VSRLNIVVLIDALGWTYVEKYPFLNDLLPHRQPVQTVLGFSSGAIPTLLTGRPPIENGHWNLFYFDPKGSPFRWLKPFRVLPRRIIDNRVSRKIVQQLGRRVLGMGPLFECCVSPALLPWFNWIEKKNIYGPGGITGAPSIFDQLQERGVPHKVYSYHRHPDDEILRSARADVERGDIQFLFLYLCEMDMFLHLHCNDEAAWQAKLKWYEEQLRSLFTLALQKDPQATITVLSDHGMAPVTRSVDLLGEIEQLQLRMPEDYLAVYDSTMARFWFFTERGRQAITECLQRQSCGRILTPDELKAFGVYFEDGRFGEAIFLLNPGTILTRSDFNGVGWSPAGMHGYHPDDRYSDAIYLSNKAPRYPVRHLREIHANLFEEALGEAAPAAAVEVTTR
jgi:type I phosphodiesterase/nucleotide pyrophosphatase